MKRLHRAWAICLGCTLMLFVCGGLSVNAFSVTQPYVLAYGGFTNTQTSMINTIRALSYLGCMFCLLYTSPSPRDRQKSRMPSSA